MWQKSFVTGTSTSLLNTRTVQSINVDRVSFVCSFFSVIFRPEAGKLQVDNAGSEEHE